MDRTHILAKAFWGIIGLLFLTPAFATDTTDPITLPSDLITIDKICNEYRSILNLKLQEMRKTFILKEVSPGIIHFMDSNQEIIATIHFSHEMNEDKTQKIETVRITDDRSRSLIEEKTITRGKNMKFTSAQNLIFFDPYYEGSGTHCSLFPDEDHKEIVVTTADSPIFKIMGHRSIQEKSQISGHQIYLGEKHVLSIQETTLASKLQRKVEYTIDDSNYDIKAIWLHVGLAGAQTGKIWLTGLKKPDSLLAHFQYFSQFMNTRGVRGDLSLNEFLNETLNRVYLPFIKNGIMQSLEALVAYVWPQTTRQANAAADSRFLDELQTLRKQVDDAQTNPSLLIQIKTKILEFIGEIQEGTLRVNDRR